MMKKRAEVGAEIILLESISTLSLSYTLDLSCLLLKENTYISMDVHLNTYYM